MVFRAFYIFAPQCAGEKVEIRRRSTLRHMNGRDGKHISETIAPW
jgi:hypothetical protein